MYDGEVMPAWFDRRGLEADTPEDVDGIEASTRIVHDLIDAEVASGIPASRVVVAGFSMGGALALYSGLTYPQKIAGIVVLSSFALQRDKLPGSHTANAQTPVFLGHGAADSLVPLSLCQLTDKFLKAFNPNVDVHVYKGLGHTSSPQEIREMSAFIRERLG